MAQVSRGALNQRNQKALEVQVALVGLTRLSASFGLALREVGNKANARVVFNVQNPRTEPLLTVSDYLCWAVQRVFEKGETRHYDYLAEKIRLVVDLYDRDKYAGYRNYYDKKNPLTAANKIGPHVT